MVGTEQIQEKTAFTDVGCQDVGLLNDQKHPDFEELVNTVRTLERENWQLSCELKDVKQEMEKVKELVNNLYYKLFVNLINSIPD